MSSEAPVNGPVDGYLRFSKVLGLLYSIELYLQPCNASAEKKADVNSRRGSMIVPYFSDSDTGSKLDPVDDIGPENRADILIICRPCSGDDVKLNNPDALAARRERVLLRTTANLIGPGDDS